MSNLLYVRAEGTDEYNVMVHYPTNSKKASEAKNLLAECKTAMKVGERKTVESGQYKWVITMDEFSVMYACKIMSNNSTVR